jgi:hypothetical protein
MGASKPKLGLNTGNAGKGRPKGVPNKLNKQLKEMILGALDTAGGEDYLVTQSRENPTAFLTLIGKVLPLQLTGENGGAIVVSWAKSEAEGTSDPSGK